MLASKLNGNNDIVAQNEQTEMKKTFTAGRGG
jgi:hypothetical protein